MILLFCGIFANLILLLSIPEERFIIRSISITLISSLSIFYYLYKRYKRNFCLQSDLMVSVNTLVQFLLPVFYLVFYYNINPQFDRHLIRYAFAIGSFAVLLGQSMFFLGYESAKRGFYFPKVKLEGDSYIISKLWFFIFVLALVWSSRLYLLTTGTYYWAYRSSYEFESPWFSIFTQLDHYGGLIIVFISCVMLLTAKNRKVKRLNFLITSIILILELTWIFPSGAREFIAYTLLAPFIAFIFIKRRIPKLAFATLLIIFFFLIFLMPILEHYRYVISEHADVNEINPKKTVTAIGESADKVKSEERSYISRVAYRLYDGASLAYLLANYSNYYDFEFGKTYKHIPYVFIPRFLFPYKPVFTTPLDNWFSLTAGGSSPVTIWGESYINFSWVGIIFISYFLGLGMKFYDLIFSRRMHKLYWVCLYCFILLIILRLPMQALVVWISEIIKIPVLAFIFTKVDTLFRKSLGAWYKKQ